jgi:hypothetical protein
LLGLSNIDPAYEQQQRLKKFTFDELAQLHDYEDYLIWKKSKNSK